MGDWRYRLIIHCVASPWAQALIYTVRTVAAAMARLRDPDGVAGLIHIAKGASETMAPLLASSVAKPREGVGSSGSGSGKTQRLWQPSGFGWLKGMQSQVSLWSKVMGFGFRA